MSLWSRYRGAIAVGVLALSGLALAQNEPFNGDQPGNGGPAGDPPSRVARLQYMDGDVSLQPGGVDDWVPATLNRPLTTADRIWTDRDARAELTMASAALRMGAETSVTLTNLDDNTAQIELDQGVLNLSVRFLNAGEIVEVDTPNFAYTINRPGEYRFDVLPDQDESWITVWHGDGEATGQGNAVRVRNNQQFRFSAGQSLSHTYSRAPERDGFDDWCAVRERRETTSASASYVAAGTVGYEDLDDNGYWEPSPTYGTVWYPRVHAGWAPYREGHWAWVEPWGWTWVDDAPWGFAPFHYGRWVSVGDRWGWVPGPVGVRPVYAPALVGWVGGAGFGVSIGIGGGVGWFPLGWHDPYLPAYRVSPRYAREVNISNSRVVNVTVVNNYYSTTNVNVRNTTVNNIRYENTTVRGAVTGVSRNTFQSGQPVGRNSVIVPPGAVNQRTLMTTATVAPTKAAVLGGRTPAAAPQHMIAPREVVSRVAPPARQASFEQQRPLLEKNNGVPLSPEVRAKIPASNPAPGNRAPAGNQVGQRPYMPGPGGNPTGGRVPAANPQGGQQQGGNQPFGRSPAANVPGAPQRGTTTPGAGTPGAGNVNGQPTPGRMPTGSTQPPESATTPGHNVPRPPQSGGTNTTNGGPNTPYGGANNGQRTPGTMNPAPRGPVVETPRGNQGGQSPVPQSHITPAQPIAPVAPTHTAPPAPARSMPESAPTRNVPAPAAPTRSMPESAPTRNVPAPPAPARSMPESAPTRNVPAPAAPTRSMPESAPTHNAPAPAPPAHSATPAPPHSATPAPPAQHHNPPPAKDNKDSKEKDKK